MTCVVDASVAVKWFVEEDWHEEAMQLLDDQGALVAPDLIVPEITNIAWKKATRSLIDPLQANMIALGITNSPLVLRPSSQFNERALQIALDLNHPAYDCLYIACAETIESVLVTADQRLCNIAHSSEFRPLVRHLADIDP